MFPLDIWSHRTKNQELIIGDGGENIAPVPIEDQVKAACDGINEAHRIHGISMSTVAVDVSTKVQVFKIRPSKDRTFMDI